MKLGKEIKSTLHETFVEVLDDAWDDVLRELKNGVLLNLSVKQNEACVRVVDFSDLGDGEEWYRVSLDKLTTEFTDEIGDCHSVEQAIQLAEAMERNAAKIRKAATEHV